MRSAGIDVNRRLTGGGAIYFDESQIGWEVFATKNEVWARCKPERLYRKISQGLVEGLRGMGISASYRPRNDIEVEGRKISGTGGTSDGNAFMFQGTLLVKNCASAMLRALRIPAEKLGRHGLESVRERVVFLEELASPMPDEAQIKQAIVRGFEEAFGVQVLPSEPTPRELELFQKALKLIKSNEWIYRIDNPERQKGTLIGFSKGRKGIVKAALQVDLGKKRVSSAQFWGDFFISPERALYDLEALLKHQPANAEKLSGIVLKFWASCKPQTMGVNAENFAEALGSAVAKIPLLEQGFSFDEANSIFMVNIDTEKWIDFEFSYFLFPYCSKLVGCKYRHRYDCPVCGKCTVGDGYELAQKSGLRPFTITSFQSLVRAHRRLRREGVRGYIGSCCEEFFTKHIRTFLNSQLAVVIVKLDSTTCYDLSQARAAYRGEFESQTELNIPLIEKVLRMWKGREN